MSYKIILNVQRQLLRNKRNIYHYGGLSNLIVLNSFFFFTDTYKRIRSQIYQALPLLELDTFMNCERLVPIEFNVSFFVCLAGWVFLGGWRGVFTEKLVSLFFGCLYSSVHQLF